MIEMTFSPFFSYVYCWIYKSDLWVYRNTKHWWPLQLWICQFNEMFYFVFVKIKKILFQMWLVYQYKILECLSLLLKRKLLFLEVFFCFFLASSSMSKHGRKLNKVLNVVACAVGPSRSISFHEGIPRRVNLAPALWKYIGSFHYLKEPQDSRDWLSYSHFTRES